MKIIIIFCLFYFSNLNVFSQDNCTSFEFHLIGLQYKQDTLTFDFPIVINVGIYDSTNFRRIYGNTKNEYAIKYQILKTDVALKDEFVFSKCFYIKEGDKWKEIYKSVRLINMEGEGIFAKSRKGENWLKGGESSGDGFSYKYMERMTLNK